MFLSQMHPIMKNLRNALDGSDSPAADRGIAQRGDANFDTRAQIAKDKSENFGLPPATDLFREGEVKMEDERDLMFKAGESMKVSEKVLEPDDFRPDFPGSNAALRHTQAAELKRNASHTRSLEQWAHDTFMADARALLVKHSTRLGLLYLNDFLEMYTHSKPMHELAVQLVALSQHTTNRPLQRLLKDIASRNDYGELSAQWYLDLLDVMQMIVEEEKDLRTQLSAIGVTCNRMALHFAKKACGGKYPSADKLAKTSMYFRRILIATLELCERIGCYERNSVPRRPRRAADTKMEDSDETYMFSLRRALEEHSNEEEDDDFEETEDDD